VRKPKFLGGHVDDVAVLVRRVDEHYCGGTRIVLMGRLGTKSAFLLELVNVWAGKDLKFVGKWVPSYKARYAKSSGAVRHITGRK
jgi:hypothetical protein